MKVILLEDINGVGKKGDLINAAEGHARNFLLPRKLAIEATKTNLSELDSKQKSLDHKKEVELDEAKELCKKLEEQTVLLKVKSGENGKLFGSVTNKEIVEELFAKTNIKIDKKKVSIDTIKTIGEKEAEVRIHPKVIAKLKVNIISE